MKQQKNLSIATATLFLTVIFGFGVSFWVIPDKSFSENENRVLQSLPKISAQSLLDGNLSRDFNAYFTDQFPFRDSMLTVGAVTQLTMGRGEANGVLVGKGGQLAVRKFDAYISLTERAKDSDYFDKQHIQNAARALEALASNVSIPLTVFPAPRTLDVAISSFDYPADLSDRLHDTLYQALDTARVDALDMTGTYRALYNQGDYVYYHTDHHWTTLGAYTAYKAIMEHWSMGNEVLPQVAFTVRQADDFYGTTWSRARLSAIPPDTLEIWELEDDQAYVMRDQNGEFLQNGFVDENYLTGKDKYGAFLSGTRQFLTISKEGQTDVGKPRLLMARDSFASALAPFLARHFDLVLVNLSGGMTHLSAYAEDYECDRILVVCNLENFVTSDCVVRVD